MAHAFRRDGVWYVRYKSETGIWKKKSCGKDAKKAEADYLAKQYSAKELNYHHQAPVRISNSSLIEALKYFRDKILCRGIQNLEKEESPVRREQAVINNFLEFVNKYNYKEFKEITEDVARIYMEERAEDEIKPKTKREERRVLRNFFSWSIEKHYCSNNPADKIVVPKIPRKKPRFFSEHELNNIFKNAKSPYQNIYKFLYLTGLRTGELSNLEWRDFNEYQNILTIRIVSQDKKNRLPGNKTKREETIPLSKGAIKVLIIILVKQITTSIYNEEDDYGRRSRHPWCHIGYYGIYATAGNVTGRPQELRKRIQCI